MTPPHGRAPAPRPPSPARRFGPLLLDLERQRLERDGVEVRLTRTQWRLLEALLDEPGHPVSHRALAARVWGAAGTGRDRQTALRSHLRSLRAKLGDDARAPTFIRTENGLGYRWIHPGPPVPAAARRPRDARAVRRLRRLHDELRERGAVAAPEDAAHWRRLASLATELAGGLASGPADGPHVVVAR